MKQAVAYKKYSKGADYSYALGSTITIEMLKNCPQYALKVVLSSRLNQDSNIDIVYQICEKWNIPIEVNEKEINRLSDKENQFVIGIFKKFTTSIKAKEPHVALVNPSNMGNLGTIIRTCAGFGVKNLVMIRPCADIFDPKVVRASMGALFNINFEYFDSFDDYLKKYSNREIYSLMLKGATNIEEWKTINKNNVTLVFGNEATGLDDSFLDIGKSILIKHDVCVDSFNLPIAVGIALYAFMYQ